MMLDIEKICSAISEALSEKDLKVVRLHYKDPGNGASYNVDGNNQVSTIAFWPNGLCDVESIQEKTEKRSFQHYEFNSSKIALETILKEVRLAINNA